MAEKPKAEQGVHYLKLAVCFLVTLVLWWLPAPQGLPVEGWRVFAVFFATSLSFILRPIPMGPAVLVAVVTLAATQTLGDSSKESFFFEHRRPNSRRFFKSRFLAHQTF